MDDRRVRCDMRLNSDLRRCVLLELQFSVRVLLSTPSPTHGLLLRRHHTSDGRVRRSLRRQPRQIRR